MPRSEYAGSRDESARRELEAQEREVDREFRPRVAPVENWIVVGDVFEDGVVTVRVEEITVRFWVRYHLSDGREVDRSVLDQMCRKKRVGNLVGLFLGE